MFKAIKTESWVRGFESKTRAREAEKKKNKTEKGGEL